MNEDQLRHTIIAKARKKYIPSQTMNISIALELYLKHDATKNEQIPLRISTNNRPKNWVDTIGRPNCPECKKSLLLNLKENKWVCSKCGYEKKNRQIVCPECNTIMLLGQVNNHPANQVGEDLKSQWFCPKCFYDEYSTKTVQEQIKELGR